MSVSESVGKASHDGSRAALWLVWPLLACTERQQTEAADIFASRCLAVLRKPAQNELQQAVSKRYLSQSPSVSRKPHTFLHLLARENTSLATKMGFRGAFPSILAVEGEEVPDLEAP